MDARDDDDLVARVHRLAEFVLRKAYEEGRAAHGDLGFVRDAFLAHWIRAVLRRVRKSREKERRNAPEPAPASADPGGDRETDVADAVAALQAAAGADAYLAYGCEGGSGAAWQAIHGMRKRLVGLLTKHGAPPEVAESIVDDELQKLALPRDEDGTRTGFGTFTGAGTIFYFLKTIVLRRLADRGRGREEQEAPPDDDAPRPRTDPRALDPSDATDDEKEIFRRATAALDEAAGSMTRGEWLAVRLKYGRGWPQTRIARTLGVGAPRVTKLLQHAEARIRTALVSRLVREADPRALRHAVARWLAIHGFDADLPPDDPPDDPRIPPTRPADPRRRPPGTDPPAGPVPR
jgi:DNA-directed RNA polymerase specialized sigma24 family protein